MADLKRLGLDKHPSVKAKGGRTQPEPGKMNHLESRYAEQLEADRLSGKVAWWKFDAMRLVLADRTTLAVDFVVMLADGEIQFHDTKGMRNGKMHVEDDAAVKMKMAAKLFWPFRFFYVKLGPSGFELKEVRG